MDIRRGDIFFVRNNGISTGCEMQGSRPAIIVSNDKANQYSQNVTVVWMTSQDKHPLPTHCTIKAQMLSTVLCESINTVSKERLDRYMRSLTEDEMAEVDRCLGIAIGLSNDAEINEDEIKEMFEEMIRSMDNCFYEEPNSTKAEGIDIATREVRKMYRRVLTEGV